MTSAPLIWHSPNTQLFHVHEHTPAVRSELQVFNSSTRWRHISPVCLKNSSDMSAQINWVFQIDRSGFGSGWLTPGHNKSHLVPDHVTRMCTRWLNTVTRRGCGSTLGGFLTSVHLSFQALTLRSLRAVLIINFMIMSPYFPFSCDQRLHRLENIHLTYPRTLRCSLSVLKEIQKYRCHSNTFTCCCSRKQEVYFTS